MDKVVGQVFDVFLAFAEWRNLHGNHVETVVEVFAETLLGDFLLQVPVCGRDDADIDVLGLVRSEGANFFALQDSQKLDLGV